MFDQFFIKKNLGIRMKMKINGFANLKQTNKQSNNNNKNEKKRKINNQLYKYFYCK